MSLIRSFIALPATLEIRERAAAVIQDLRGESSGIKWQDPQKLHLTLKFLGSVETDVLNRIGQVLSTVARYHSAFDLVYEGLGAFPTLERANVLWIGTRESSAMQQLHRAIEEAMAEFGFERDTKPFHPHLTLARMKGLRDPRLTAKVKSVTFLPVSTRCTTLLLMRSDLHPESSRYTVLQSIPLLS